MYLFSKLQDGERYPLNTKKDEVKTKTENQLNSGIPPTKRKTALAGVAPRDANTNSRDMRSKHGNSVSNIARFRLSGTSTVGLEAKVYRRPAVADSSPTRFTRGHSNRSLGNEEKPATGLPKKKQKKKRALDKARKRVQTVLQPNKYSLNKHNRDNYTK